ncbi:MAG: DUF192 domain-containing protein [Alphaproteobacteria bacterium]|nr:DUF192 domain-containing protein [Alphaproteobacteria bacterium]
MKQHFAAIFTLLALWLPGAAAAQQSQLATTLATSRLVIVSESGRHEFTVELAATPGQRAQGLMYRRSMAADAGMLFDFGKRGGRASMWMKNTFIPLDMLFIRADGEIESIAARTVPHSLESISSRGPVRGVLELNGGTASRLGIKPGDRVEHGLFGTAD